MASLLEQLFPRIELAESGGDPFAISPKGAQGIMQLMPGTMRDPGFGVRPFNQNASDPIAENRRVGREYFTAMFNRYGDVPTALIAYNWGPGNADKWIAGGRNPAKLPTETRNYVQKIMGDKSMAVGYGIGRGAGAAGSANLGLLGKQTAGGLLSGLLGNADGADLLGGGDWRSNLGPMLLNLGAGIAGGANQGWGPGIGQGLALAGQARQNQREEQLQRLLLGMKLAEFQRPELKNIKLPGGAEVSAMVGPGGVSPLDTSPLGELPAANLYGGAKDQAQVESDIRKQFTTLSGDFIKVRDSYAKIREASKAPSAAGDLALIFNYMRLLDPGSTVREGEFANAQNSAGVPDRIRNVYNQLMRGERLAPEQRADFVKTAKGLFASQETQHKKLEQEYRGIAKRLRLDEKNVVPDLSIIAEPAIAAPLPGAPPVSGGGLLNMPGGPQQAGTAPSIKSGRYRYDPVTKRFIPVQVAP